MSEALLFIRWPLDDHSRRVLSRAVHQPALRLYLYLQGRSQCATQATQEHLSAAQVVDKPAFMNKTCKLKLFYTSYQSISRAGAETSSSLLLSGLAGLFDVVAVEQPCLDVVPLLSFAGWQNGRTSISA